MTLGKGYGTSKFEKMVGIFVLDYLKKSAKI